jgi:hypothetical protein
MKRTIADGFVGPACRIAGERRGTKGVVAVTRGIAKKCLETNGRVGAADRVAGKRARTIGRIGVAGGVGSRYEFTNYCSTVPATSY